MAEEEGETEAARVRAWLQDQGYGVETLTARAFSEAGFAVRQGLTYRDDAAGKVREVDVEARAILTASKVEMHVVAECKRSKSPWVTRTTSLRLRKGYVEWQPISTPSVERHLKQNRLPLADAFEVPRPTDFDVVQAFRDDPGSGDPAYKALSQVVSAAVGLLASSEMFPNPALIHPIIVLDAHLFRATFGPYPTTDLEEVPWTRVHWSGAQNLSSPVLVDIVTVPAIDGYARDMRYQLGELAEELERVPGDFR